MADETPDDATPDDATPDDATPDEGSTEEMVLALLRRLPQVRGLLNAALDSSMLP